VKQYVMKRFVLPCTWLFILSVITVISIVLWHMTPSDQVCQL